MLRLGIILAAVLLTGAACLLLPRNLSSGELLSTLQALQAAHPWLLPLGAWMLLWLWALLLPTMLPILLCGALFGAITGSIIAYSACTASFLTAFAAARLGRDRARRWLSHHPRLGSIEAGLSQQGWRLVILLRLSPIIPFHLQNYAYGLSNIPLWTCTWATCLGKLPQVLLTVLLGMFLGEIIAGNQDANTEAQFLRWVSLGLGGIASVFLLFVIARWGRRGLARIPHENRLADRVGVDDVSQAKL